MRDNEYRIMVCRIILSSKLYHRSQIAKGYPAMNRQWLLICLALVAGCSEARPSAVTPGAAKKYIIPGETTQIEVLEIFATPNIVTRDRGAERWVYDKVSSKRINTFFGIGGIGGGGGGSGFGGGGIAGGVGSSERSETTVMLIIYFDKNDVVRDYKISQTKF